MVRDELLAKALPEMERLAEKRARSEIIAQTKWYR